MEDEREEELSAIAAIFPELLIDPQNPYHASIDLSAAPAIPIPVAFPTSVDAEPCPTLHTSLLSTPQHMRNAPSQSSASEVRKLSYLPPLHLDITLPDGYPAERPPDFAISTSPSWLPDETVTKLREEGPVLWEEYGRGQVVFAFIDFLQQAAEQGFDIGKDGASQLEVSQAVKVALLDFDSKEKRKRFEQETFDCGVCLEPKKGSICYRLSRCQHVFCVPCLQDFYNSCITEGDISSVRCMAPDCGRVTAGQNGTTTARKRRSDRTLSPSELLQIPLEASVVRRYVELKRKKRLESDKSTVYCPRKWCQGPARSNKYPKINGLTDFPDYSDSDSEPETEDAKPTDAPPAVAVPPADRLAICEDCSYAFCRVCQQGWHGEFKRCWPRSTVEVSEDEKASYEYIRLHTSPCPTCSSPAQKTHGCNHMRCFQCNTHFCYLCSSWLDADNPYGHFNTKKSSCYMRLWELEEGDEGERNIRFEGARGWEAAIAAAEEADDAEEQAHERRGDRDANRIQGPDQYRDRNGDGPRQQADAPIPPEQPPLARQQDRVQRDVDARPRAPPVAPADEPAVVAALANIALEDPAPDANMPQQHAREARARGGPDRRDEQQRARVGLQRFLEMVRADEEDAWDSDELDEDLEDDGVGDDRWAIPER